MHLRRRVLPAKGPLGERGTHRSVMHLRTWPLPSRYCGSPRAHQVDKMLAMCWSRKSLHASFFCAKVALDHLHGSFLLSS